MTVADGCFAQVAEEGGPQLYRVRVAQPEARAAVGSGDAFLAGYVAARYSGRSPAECLRFGVACGAESTQHFGAGVIDPRRSSGCCDEVESSARAAGARSRLECRLGVRKPAGSVVAADVPSAADPRMPLMEVEIGRGQEGAPRLRLRRHRDRALAAHARPRRRRHLLDARPLPLRAAAARLRDGRRRLAQTAGIVGELGGLAVLNLEGILTRYEDADAQLERIAAAAQARRPRARCRRSTGAGQAGADRPADPRDQGAGRRRRRLADAPARARATTRSRSRRGSTSSSSRARSISAEHVSTDERAAAEPQGVHPRDPRAGRRRRLRLLPHGPAPHAHRRRRRARRRRPGRGVHDARRARHRRAPGDGDRRRRGRPLAAHARDRRVRARSSPTAACATAATSPRRSPAAPTR